MDSVKFSGGFLVLSDVAEFCYKVTDFYRPGDEGGLAWNDPDIGIQWPEVTGHQGHICILIHATGAL